MTSLLPAFGASPVYIYDLNLDQRAVVKAWQDSQAFTPDLIDFQARVFARSGLSPTETHLPPTLNPAYVGFNARNDLDSAAKECKMAVCGAVEGLLRKTGLSPADIDILVTTCSIYCPTPSMASMVVNAFGLRKEVQAYHLGGMGCANGVVAVNLVADLLKAHPNSNALFVTTETCAPAFYPGKERHRLVTNLLFRMGAAAVLLTNKPSLARPAGRGRRGAKYQLLRRVRVHTGQAEDAYTAIHSSPDDEGINGIYLGKNVVKEASRALALAMVKIAPHVLTWRQLAEAAIDALQRRREAAAAAAERRRQRRLARDTSAGGGGAGGDKSGAGGSDKSVKSNDSDSSRESAAVAAGAGAEKADVATTATSTPTATAASATPAARPPYRPNFQQSTISHFLLHAGGAKVLDGLGEALRLDDTKLAPSRAVLHDFGNVSSSTTWYTLAFVETTAGLKAGERVMQVGVGSGIKCGVNVWKALRDVREVHEAWSHRLTPLERSSLVLEHQVDVAHGWAHISLRALFAVLMVLLAAAMHWLMLQRAVAAAAGGGRA
ncbi:hypothetical protein PLESTB_000341000 [Pleodorina starrii]|uniref:3-ketoacyl-CoA synthase n=1 Tax=Pleodorina starrii TaxID=330485 RepID=A0A9W6BDI5_9CHLO|nr:hypothetical protein PLESTB_000341000 [Pleodorina starrii]